MTENQPAKSVHQQSQMANSAQANQKAALNKTKNANKKPKPPKQTFYKDPITPIEQRECTDIFCLFVFIALVGIILSISVYAWTAGNFQKMKTAYDSDGKGCGTDYPDYPYIYFASPHTDSLWVTTCVSKCPLSTDSVLACKTNSVVKICSPVKDSNNTKSVQIYDTSLTANIACLPTSDKVKNQIAAAFGGSATSMSALINNYNLILISLPVAILIAVTFMILIRCTAKLFIYMLIIFSVACLLAIGVYMVLMSGQSSSSIIMAVICFTIAFVIILVVFCIRRRLALASIVIKVAANFISNNFLIVLLPVGLFVITILYLALWILQALGFYSLGTPTISQHQYPFQHFNINSQIQVLFVFHIVQLLWVLLFFIQTSNFIVGGTASGWYFQRQRPYSQASERYRKKHIGSVCFGSLMMVLLGFVRIIYNIFVPKRQAQGLANIFKKCCDFFCCVCNKLFQWFTVGAFTITNIRGTTYCNSGSEAVYLKIKSLSTSSVVSLVQAVFNLLVCLGITFTTVFAINLLIKNVPTFHQNVKDDTLILIIVGFVAFTISCFFISVYADAIDAIYMSYLVDRERGDRETPADLKQFLDEAQKEK